MEATFNSSVLFCPHQSLRMRDVCQRFNVSPTTIRRATADGSLSCLTLPSGHRRFREQDVLSWLGVAGEEIHNGGGIPVAAVIRVSSKNQNRPVGGSEKSSLQHQEERVREYIQNRWGDKARVTWYRSVGSGMNFERKEFLQLIPDVLAGKFKGGFLVATDFTRVCRFGIKMVEFLAAKGGCQIVYSLSSEEKDENETLTDEIMSILTHYTARASGQKNKAINQTQMTEDQLRDAFHWYKSGHSYRAIAERLKNEGRGLDEKGRIISRHVVKMRMKDNWAVLEKMYGSDKVKNSFVEWAEKFVRKSQSEKTKISRKRIVEVYQQWCKETKKAPLSCRRIGTFTKKWAWDRCFDSKGSVVFVGLSLNTNK